MLHFTLIFQINSINRKNWNCTSFVSYTFKRKQKLATLHTDLLTGSRYMIQEPLYRLNSNSPSLSLPSATTKLLLLLRWQYIRYECSGNVKKYIHGGGYDIYSCLIGASKLANCRGTYALTNFPFYLKSNKIIRRKIKTLQVITINDIVLINMRIADPSIEVGTENQQLLNAHFALTIPFSQVHI